MSWKRQALAEGASDSGSMEACTGVDALPDELLLLIFSKLQDGRTLLDTLPRVCRRWRRVARDPAAWAAVELTVKNNVAEETRILLHAPAAKALTLDPELAVPGFPLMPAGLRVRSALRRTRLVVRCLTILETGRSHEVKNLQVAVASFLLRQRDSLLHLCISLFHHEDCGVAATLGVVAKLHRLTKLDLMVCIVPEVKYAGELRGRLPELRQLTVHSFVQRVPDSDADDFDDLALVPRGLIGDLVRGAPALRVLNLEMPVGADREACAALRAVEHLSLNAPLDEWGVGRPDGDDAVATVQSMLQLVEAMETPALRTATVALCDGEHPRYSLEVKGRCQAVLDEFSLRLPRVALSLNMDGPECSQCLLRPEDCPRLAWFAHQDDGEDDGEDDIEDVIAEDGVVEDGVVEDVIAQDAVVAEDAADEDVDDDSSSDDSGSAADAEDFLAEGVLDSEPEASFVAEPDDFCDSDCSLCSVRTSSPSEAATASEPEDPDMFYPNEL